MSPTRFGETEENPLFFRASSARLKVPSIATVLIWDLDMRANVHTRPPLMHWRPKGEKKPGAAGERHAPHKQKCIIYTHLKQ